MSFTYKNLDGEIIKESGNSMPASDLMGLPSITGGASAPSSALSYGSNSYVAMNNPFSVAGAGGSARATAETSTGYDIQSILLFLAVGGAVLLVLK